jgi:hypothetical protein
VLFLFPEVRKKDEHVGEPRLRGVWGEEEEDESWEDLRRGNDCGRTIASGGATGRRLACIAKAGKRQKEREGTRGENRESQRSKLLQRAN